MEQLMSLEDTFLLEQEMIAEGVRMELKKEKKLREQEQKEKEESQRREQEAQRRQEAAEQRVKQLEKLLKERDVKKEN